jgi:hypothetical protein
MRKTLLAALIGASVFAVLPALAQVRLGGAGHVGAGVTAGANGAVGATAGQLGTRAGDTLQRADRQTRHAADRAMERSHSTLDRHARADADIDAQGSAAAGTGAHHAHANVGVRAGSGVHAGAATDHADGAARGIGDQVSDSAHTAIDSTGRTAGSVGDTVRRTATEGSVGADAKVRAKADGHGH